MEKRRRQPDGDNKIPVAQRKTIITVGTRARSRLREMRLTKFNSELFLAGYKDDSRHCSMWAPQST
jgi:hypothetical protein